jgi:hypothetical protein
MEALLLVLLPQPVILERVCSYLGRLYLRPGIAVGLLQHDPSLEVEGMLEFVQ